MISKSTEFRNAEFKNSHPNGSDSAGGLDPRLRLIVCGRRNPSPGNLTEDPRYRVQQNVGGNTSDKAISNAIDGVGW